MTKFELINGQLCRMVEPTPLQLDSPMPCVVRLIQDDSPMGRMNRAKYDKFSKLDKTWLICDVYNNDRLDAHIHYTQFEIIGYPVEEGSHWWALWQMEQGKIVSNNSFIEPLKLYQYTIYTIGGKVYCSANAFVDTVAHKTGWQLYEPKPEPKPLLADAKVGDLCKRRDGKWVQIDSISNDRPCPIMCKSDIGGMDCFTLDGRNHNAVGGEKDIISTEPLAPEGTAEWAWQMMLLGKSVIHLPSSSPNAEWKMTDGKARGKLAGMYANSKPAWLRDAVPTGWTLYEEPDHIAEDKKVEPKPEPEPAKEQFEVGDWVTDGVVVGHITVINDGKAWVKTQDTQYHLSLEHLRKLDRSEVKVRVALEGTVKPCSVNTFELCTNEGSYWIGWKELDPATRSLVESLLKAQEESCHL